MSKENVANKLLGWTWYRHSLTAWSYKKLIEQTLLWPYPEALPLRLSLFIAKTFCAIGSNLEEEFNSFACFEVDELLDVVRTRYKSLDEKRLSTAEVLRPGDTVGQLHFGGGLRELEPEENLIAFTRTLYRDGQNSLRTLASLCAPGSGEDFFEDIQIFTGITHLAPLAKRLGFDVSPIHDPLLRWRQTHLGKQIVRETAGRNEYWRKISRNYKPAQEVFISKSELLRRYGSRGK